MLPIPEMSLDRNIIYRGFQIPCEIFLVHSVWDSEYVHDADTSKEFYMTKKTGTADKKGWRANFYGDKAIIRQNRYFECWYMSILLIAENAQPRFLYDDYAKIRDQGQVIVMDDKEEVVNERLGDLMSGAQLDFIAVQGDPAANAMGKGGIGAQADVFRFVEPLVLPGGQGVSFRIFWDVVGGLDLSADYLMLWKLYGAELIPVGNSRQPVTKLDGTEK